MAINRVCHWHLTNRNISSIIQIGGISMSNFEKSARKIVEKHGCIFIKMIGECGVLWKNKYGV